MRINSAKFVGSYARLDQIPKQRLPEIAFSGRSNVGKSSLINCLVNRSKLALTSSTPGKTRLLNYYSVNDAFYLVDLPGFGYAKVAQQERQSWKKLIESFFVNSKFLKGVIHIIDSRHGLTALDHELIDWLADLKLPLLLVATKTDKLPRSKANYMLEMIMKEADAIGIAGVVPFSAITKLGTNEIWKAIVQLISRESSR
ncbi:MAG: ribosome biogenesis GTP-binding protein YihA/YsxC [bacterium]|nr:ribosome biogenesis GTP-binding protein YihA/YsxC [bacterium]